jgi:hypothetical protein
MRRQLSLTVAVSALLILAAPLAAPSDSGIEFRSLSGSGNNAAHSDWGKAGVPYSRVAVPTYAFGDGNTMEGGPSARYVSNRIFNDIGQNLFSENGVSQIGWLWGQFVDHTLDLRDGTPGESKGIPYTAADPLEAFRNDFSELGFFRTLGIAGTGTSAANPRQQVNTVNSFIDAWNVYGGTETRLDWTRAGTEDAADDLTNNSASLLLPGNYLPFANARGNADTAPAMDLMGPLTGHKAAAIVAGDVRANENTGLTAIQTLFAREHNRIVAALDANPLTMGFSNQLKFDIARRVVGAEQQYITYNEFLPAMNVKLSKYPGYQNSVDATVSNEFATVGFRAHSQIHGEMEPFAPLGTYTQAQLAAFAAKGITQAPDTDQIHLVIPLSLTFGNPSLVRDIGVGPLLKGLAAESQYKNDEQFDNQLRSVLFQIPSSPTAQCLDVPDPACFSVVSDLAAIDVARARDHGIPTYNTLREKYGLTTKTSFTALTGELSDAFPAGVGVNDLPSLDFLQLRDRAGNVVPLDDSAEGGVAGLRRSSLAARLKAVYGSVDDVDAFTGMVAEPHAAGFELGELQLAIWKKQFEALRDGDRFFYANDNYLNDVVVGQYGISYKTTLADVITNNTDSEVQADVFKAPIEPGTDSIGVVAAYGFDEARGAKVRDSSGRGNNGTAAGTAWATGKYGSALSFNGSSSSVTIPDTGSLDLTNGMTLEAWVKPNAQGPSWRTVLFKEMPTGMDYSLYANNDAGLPIGQAQIRGEQSVVGPSALPLGTWTYLAATYDGSTESLYVDGTQVASAPLEDSIEVSDGNLRIGGNSIWSEWFSGLIDEVRVYNRALPQNEIQIDMTTPISAFPVMQAGAPGVVGEQHVEPDSNPAVHAGQAEAYSTVATSSDSIENIRVYVDSDTTAETLFAGIYSDKDGHPGKLLASGSLDEPVPNAWNTVAVPAQHIASGTTYWIALLGGGGLLQYRDRCCTVAGTGPTETEANTALEDLPLRWTTGIVYDDGPMSAYASG